MGTLGGWELAQRPSDNLLGMAQSVDGRGVHPVDATRDRVLDGRDRIGVVLASPAVGPTSTADGPRAAAAPVVAPRAAVLDGRDRIGVVLASPAVGPTSTADGPRAEADLSDLKT